MKTQFELHVSKVWDAVMPESRWSLWNEDHYLDTVVTNLVSTADEVELYREDSLRFAAAIAREAFRDGHAYGAIKGAVTDDTMQEALDKRFPSPSSVRYRIAGPDTNGNRWQVRDGVTWISQDYAPFRKHIAVNKVIQALASLGEWDNVAIVANLAAVPTL